MRKVLLYHPLGPAFCGNRRRMPNDNSGEGWHSAMHFRCIRLQSVLKTVAIQSQRCALDLFVFALLLGTMRHIKLSVPVNLIASYGATWVCASRSDSSHLVWCRSSTSVAASIITALQYSLNWGMVVLFVVAALPRVLLWWPRRDETLAPFSMITDNQWRGRYVEVMRDNATVMTRSIGRTLERQWDAMTEHEKQHFKDEHFKSVPILDGEGRGKNIQVTAGVLCADAVSPKCIRPSKQARNPVRLHEQLPESNLPGIAIPYPISQLVLEG